MIKVSEWPKLPLNEIADLTLSSVDKKSKPNEESVRLCNYMDVYSNSFISAKLDFMDATATEREIANCSLLTGDVVITKDSEKYDDIGVPALVREDVPGLVCGYHLAILRPRPSCVDGAYLFYALNDVGAREQFYSYANGVTRFSLRKSDIGLVQIAIPPLPQQRRIASILGALDDRIELNRRMNETLEQLARALFQSWFVNFDPVRARLEGRWRRGQSLPGLPAELYDLFPNRLVPSELGEIPEGWGVKALDEIADFKNGLALQKFRPTDDEERLPVVKIAQLRTGKADGSEWAKSSIISDCIIDDGDVVFSWSGSLLVKVWCGGPAALNQHLFKVTSKQYPKWFYFRCIESHLSTFQAIAAGKTTTMGHIKRDHLTEAKSVVPDAGLLSAIDKRLAELFSKYVSTNVQSRTLAAQRDTLLPKLLSGEVMAHGNG